jgi:translation elongation factor EF-1alpha
MYYVVISSHNPNLDCFRGPALIEYLDHLSLANSSQDADKPVRMPIVDRYKVSVTAKFRFKRWNWDWPIGPKFRFKRWHWD